VRSKGTYNRSAVPSGESEFRGLTVSFLR